MMHYSSAQLLRAAVLTVSAFFLSCGAQAQAPAPAPAITQAPAGLPPLEPSDAHLTAAIEVVKLSGISRSIDLIVPQMVDKARQLFSKMRPELAGDIEKSIKDLQPDFDQQKTLALQIAARSFALRLSEPDLKELETFFKSAIGKKYVESQPAIVEQMTRSLDGFTQQLSQVVVDKMREDLKKKGITF